MTIALSWAAQPSRFRWSPPLTWLLGTWIAFVFSQVGHTYLAMTITAFKDFFTNVFIACSMVFILDSRKRLQGFATVWVWATVFLAIVGVIVAVVFLNFGSSSRINEIDSKEQSAQGRIAAWSEGLQMFKRNPVIGVGYGMFTNSYPLTAHNSFVLSFAETGLIGAYFWVGLLYVSLLGFCRLAAASRTFPPDPWLR